MYSIIQYFSLFVGLFALILIVWSLIQQQFPDEVKFAYGAMAIVAGRSVFPALHNLGYVEAFSYPFLWLNFAFMGFSANLGYYIYRYINYLVFPVQKRTYGYWHFIPFILVTGNLLAFLISGNPIEIKGDYFETWLDLDLYISLRYWIYMFMGLVLSYLFAVLIEIKRNTTFLKNYIENFKPLLSFTVLLMITVSFILILGIDYSIKITLDSQDNEFASKIGIIKPCFILVILYLFYRFPFLLNPLKALDAAIIEKKFWRTPQTLNTGAHTMPHEKFKSLDVVEQLIDQIETHINNKKVFRNDKFGLMDLASGLQIPSGHLRYLFQEYCELSFVDFRNYKRVEDFKDFARNKAKNQHLNLEGIGEKCGFGSMNSLNRSVKKFENCTPGELWQWIK